MLLLHYCCIIVALLLHDAIKYDLPKKLHTVKNHPDLSAKFFVNCWKEFNETREFDMYDKEVVDIESAITTHMGRWTPYTYVQAIPTPFNFPSSFGKLDQIVHLADVVSSYKQVDILCVQPKGE